MKKLGVILIAIGCFALYGAYRMNDSQRFAYGHSKPTQSIAASQAPDDFKKSVYIALGLGVFGIISGSFCIARAKRK